MNDLGQHNRYLSEKTQLNKVCSDTEKLQKRAFSEMMNKRTLDFKIWKYETGLKHFKNSR